MLWRFQSRRKSSPALRSHPVWPLSGNILYWCCRPQPAAHLFSTADIHASSPLQNLPDDLLKRSESLVKSEIVFGFCGIVS